MKLSELERHCRLGLLAQIPGMRTVGKVLVELLGRWGCYWGALIGILFGALLGTSLSVLATTTANGHVEDSERSDAARRVPGTDAEIEGQPVQNDNDRPGTK